MDVQPGNQRHSVEIKNNDVPKPSTPHMITGINLRKGMRLSSSLSRGLSASNLQYQAPPLTTEEADKMEVQPENHHSHRRSIHQTHRKQMSNDMEIVQDDLIRATTEGSILSLPAHHILSLGGSPKLARSTPSTPSTPQSSTSSSTSSTPSSSLSNSTPPMYVRQSQQNLALSGSGEGTPSPRSPLTSSGSPPVFSDIRVAMRMERRLSQRNMLYLDTSSLTSPTLDANGSPVVSARNSLSLSRPTTPTLTGMDGAYPSPRGGSSSNNLGNGSPRGSPDSPSLLPRSASDQTPRKKTVDDFHIGKVLGEGSYGAVVLGVDKESGAQYAIKILERKHIMKENKIDILATCFHPGIVKLFYTFRSDTSLYYVLELCPNGELLSHIKQFGGLEEECAKFYAAEIVEALEYLHSKGIVHRDLKPENILLSADWHIKLTDFGTAKVLGTEKGARSGSFVGTAEYMAPELIGTSKQTCCASDLWALGSIIYQLLTSKLPFRAKTPHLTFQKVLEREITFPANFPNEARDLIERLLVLAPDERIGAKEGGFDDLKKHPFFNGINWGKLRDEKPPTMRKPAYPFYKIFDELSPPPSPTAHQLMLRTSSSNLLAFATSNNSSPSNSPRSHYTAQNYPETKKWTKYLNPEEYVAHAGLVWKRKGLSIKKRYLILTTTPRLFYIEPKKMVVRGEIPWSEHLRPELKNASNFYIHTPKRKYVLEDTGGNAQKWVDELNNIINLTKGKPQSNPLANSSGTTSLSTSTSNLSIRSSSSNAISNILKRSNSISNPSSNNNNNNNNSNN